jgi:hypothetical protein
VNEILLMLHFFGLGAGFAAAVGNPIVMRAVAASPADAPALGKVQPMLARAGQVGLGLLWFSGLILVWSKWGGVGAMPWMFWVKILAVIGVTAAVVMLARLAPRARAGDAGARALLPMVGAASGVCLALVVIFAVLAFG